jgi:hypothetical protein
MAKPLHTYIFCLDDHRGYSEEVKKRFADSTRYSVIIAHNRDEMMRNIESRRDGKSPRVAILGLHDSKENFEMAERIIADIKNTDIRIGIILVIPPEKVDEVKKIIRSNVDAYVPRNTNSILRIHNTVKKLISEFSLRIYRRRRKLSLYVLTGFLLLSLAFTLFAYFRLSHYF